MARIGRSTMLSPNFPPRLFASGLPHPVLGRVQDGELQGRRAGLPARRRHHRQHPGGGAQHLRPGPLQPLPPAQRQQGWLTGLSQTPEKKLASASPRGSS